MNDLVLDNPFWRFSLRVYAEPEVRDECLALQDTYGIDVNLLLFAAWLAAERGIRIAQADTAAIQTFSEQWYSAVVLPLRSVRRSVKEMELISRPQVGDFRRKAAAVELAAEKIEQALLFEWAARQWPRDRVGDVTLVHENIVAYLSTCQKGAESVPQAPALERASRALNVIGD